MFDVAIIGAGLVGLATAFRLMQKKPGLRIVVLEKEPCVGAHQSSHNSGVLHAGLYYRPGSYKARLAVTGLRQMVEFCSQHGIPYEQCGKVVVATSDAEVPRLRELFERGQANGLRGLRILSPEELKELEPHAYGVAAIHVPEEGIVDYRAVCDKLASLLVASGVEIKLKAKVQKFLHRNSNWVLVTEAGDFESSFIICCAGLQADRLARMTSNISTIRIVPFRGEYYRLRPEREYLVRNLIYPVPDPKFPFLGVHFTRIIGGGVEAGPNAVLALGREAYLRTEIDVKDLWDVFTFPGFWKFVLKHFRMCTFEFYRSLSKSAFCRSLQKLVPEVREDDLIPAGAGVRAQAMTIDGKLVEDFYFLEGEGILHVLNAPSPAATASLAIGEEIATKIVSRLQ